MENMLKHVELIVIPAQAGIQYLSLRQANNNPKQAQFTPTSFNFPIAILIADRLKSIVSIENMLKHVKLLVIPAKAGIQYPTFRQANQNPKQIQLPQKYITCFNMFPNPSRRIHSAHTEAKCAA